MKRGKKIVAAQTRIDRNKLYNVDEAVTLMKECKYSKFDETVDIQVKTRP